ncbi:hypothetical protein BS47DRAFT_1373366 [Hydnum rufescens UP504]|uniref:Uncharacterized protein n=1 Tax=Hydnum rufescens UP504 TaxID=1448309 RepID=A0A9P6AQP7_9AGAM|nr:hypothetical protein BS47DRAFT_1373366 [Hydnum rufescens UP504]
MMDYCWQKGKKGQYSNGHEWEDVVDYHQKVFLPAMKMHGERTRKWNNDGGEEASSGSHSDSPQRTMICETPKPYAKGEGVSLMVADFVSADYGWLHSPDGKSNAWVLLKPRKNCDDYFTNDEVLDQVTAAMDILTRYYPNEKHVLIFDNAKTHSKCLEDSLSAHHMPKGTSSPECNWGFKVNEHDVDGNLVYKSDGKVSKVFKHMGDTMFNGEPQSLYFPSNHPTHPGLFKGMVVILEEHGSMIRFSNWALCYMDAYHHGLNGKEAAWAAKKYHGHHQILTDATHEVIQELMSFKKA